MAACTGTGFAAMGCGSGGGVEVAVAGGVLLLVLVMPVRFAYVGVLAARRGLVQRNTAGVAFVACWLAELVLAAACALLVGAVVWPNPGLDDAVRIMRNIVVCVCLALAGTMAYAFVQIGSLNQAPIRARRVAVRATGFALGWVMLAAAFALVAVDSPSSPTTATNNNAGEYEAIANELVAAVCMGIIALTLSASGTDLYRSTRQRLGGHYFDSRSSFVVASVMMLTMPNSSMDISSVAAAGDHDHGPTTSLKRTMSLRKDMSKRVSKLLFGPAFTPEERAEMRKNKIMMEFLKRMLFATTWGSVAIFLAGGWFLLYSLVTWDNASVRSTPIFFALGLLCLHLHVFVLLHFSIHTYEHKLFPAGTGLLSCSRRSSFESKASVSKHSSKSKDDVVGQQHPPRHEIAPWLQQPEAFARDFDPKFARASFQQDGTSTTAAARSNSRQQPPANET